MKLSKTAILALRGLDGEAKKRIIKAAGVSIYTLYRWLNTNSDNLTKAAVLPVISKETGLAESDLLEKEEQLVNEPAK